MRGERSEGALDRPDRIIMDLDPDPTVPWKLVVEASQLVQTLLNELELECVVKTTGGKGLHVVQPLRPVHAWDEVKAFSRGLAEHLVRLIPDRFVTNMSKQKRKGKILCRLSTQCERGDGHRGLFDEGEGRSAARGSTRMERTVERYRVGPFHRCERGGAVEGTEGGSVAEVFYRETEAHENDERWEGLFLREREANAGCPRSAGFRFLVYGQSLRHRSHQSQIRPNRVRWCIEWVRA